MKIEDFTAASPLDIVDSYPEKRFDQHSPENTYVALRGIGHVLGVLRGGIPAGYIEVSSLGYESAREWLRRDREHRKLAAEVRWVVSSVKDLGPSILDRYSIRGTIEDGGRAPEPFSWRVPDLGDPRFDLSRVAPAG